MKVMNSPQVAVKTPKPRLKAEKSSKNPLIAAGITFICFVLMCIMSQVYPLGTDTILVSDLEGQYAPFLYLFKNTVLNAHSLRELFYSFSLGGGKNMMATYGYYVMSPLNFLVFLFDSNMVDVCVLLIIAIKVTLSSAFMALYMTERQQDKSSYIGALLGIVYSFSSYSVCYMFQIMWLDGVFMLPLLLFFIERYIKSGKKAGIIFSLFYLFISNYYIAYMVGIYSFFHLVVRLYMEGEIKSVKTAFTKIGKFVLSAVLCAMSVAALLLPVGLDTLTNSDPIRVESGTSHIRFSVITFINQLFGGTNGEFSEILPVNPPFLFLSIFVTCSLALFFVSTLFEKKIKVLYGIVLGLIYLSLSIIAIDEAWQVFDSPNWFFHRESFVFLPFFLIIALRVYEKRNEIPVPEIIKGTGIVLGLLLISQCFGDLKNSDEVFLFRLISIVVCGLILSLFKVKNWHPQLQNMPTILPFLMALFIVVETCFFEPILSSGVSTLSTHYGPHDEYEKALLATMQLADATEVTPSTFRMERENYIKSEGGYSPSNYTGGHGISSFNSTSNKLYHRFLKQLGFRSNYNYFALSYTGASEDTDAFFSVANTVTFTPYRGASFVGGDGYEVGLNLYRNEEVLPLAFSVNSNAMNFDFYRLETDEGDKNYFEFRNDWFHSLFPDAFTEGYFYSAEDVEYEIVNGNEIDLNDYVVRETKPESDTSESIEEFDNDVIGNEKCSDYDYDRTVYRINSELPIIMNYTITAESEDELYVNITAPRILSAGKLYINGKIVDSWAARSFYSFIYRVGSYEPGTEVTVTIMSDEDSFSYQTVNFAYFNHESFISQFENVTNTVEVSEVRNGHVVMTSNLNEGEMVLTTIPYENGWEVTIDGVKAEVSDYQGALIAVNPGSGVHTIELNFTPPGLKIGAIVSVIGILGLVAFCIIDKKNFSAKKV